MPRVIDSLVLSPDQRSELQRWVIASGTPQQVALRCRIILAVAAGKTEMAIASENGVNRKTVRLWRERFRGGGPESLWEIAPGRGRKPTYDATGVKAVIDATLQTKPKGSTHWSCRTMASAQGIAKSSVSRIWRSHNIKPHHTEPFKLSRDPRFLEKRTDVVGLYLNPPDQAIVLCVDEKSQIQALQRTQPGLPLKKGRCGTMTHDYKRHGTTTLFAALDTLQGHVISMYDDRHRHQEWLKFLRAIDWVVPAELQIHMIVDNYSTHKHPKVQRWLQRHPRFHMHFTPTGCSWLNMVERFFRDLTQNRLRRGIFRSVEELIVAMDEYIRRHNQAPKPFIWTAKATDILEKVKRARVNLHNPHSA